MATKTIYVRDEDVSIWEKAASLVDDSSLSQFLTNYLKTFVAAKEAEAAGFKQRIVLRYVDKKLAAAKAFYGRWLISPENPIRKKGDFGGEDLFAVAITAKNNVVVFEFISPPDETGKFNWGRMRLFSSFEDASKDNDLPFSLVSTAMEQMGIQVEELDI